MMFLKYIKNELDGANLIKIPKVNILCVPYTAVGLKTIIPGFTSFLKETLFYLRCLPFFVLNILPPMSTSTEYISSFDFDYFRTYSFQRTQPYQELSTLHEWRSNGIILTKEQRNRYDTLHQLLANRYAETILDEDKNLNRTAVLVCEIHKTDERFATLINDLKTPIEEEILYMCAPIYRDAILFYNSGNELVEGINICFECDRIESIHKAHIKTDFKTFKYLKQLLLRSGHEIENPEEFKADYLMDKLQ